MACLVAAIVAGIGVLVAAPAWGARSSTPTYAHLYWSEPSIGRGPAGSGVNKVSRAGVNGTPVGPNFISALAFPAAVAAHGQYIYWSDSEAGAIGHCNFNHTQIDHTLLQVPEADALAVSDSYIYWTNPGRRPPPGAPT